MHNQLWPANVHSNGSRKRLWLNLHPHCEFGRTQGPPRDTATQPTQSGLKTLPKAAGTTRKAEVTQITMHSTSCALASLPAKEKTRVSLLPRFVQSEELRTWFGDQRHFSN